MFRLAKVFLASGRTQKEFCRKHDLRLSTFQFWLRLYREEKKPLPKDPPRLKPAFIPIQFSAENQPEYAWSIEYPSGVRVQFTGPAEADLLFRLLGFKAV